MKIGVRRMLVGAGIIWLIIVLCVVFFGFCSTYCGSGARCSCQLSDLFAFILVFGIPSWIFFVISIGKKKRNDSYSRE
ncbi:MAG: hypothetical protein ABH840_02130 [Nanoarchaeota archaeon]